MIADEEAEECADAILGIDPGQKGGLAFLQPETGAVLKMMPMPAMCDYADLIDMTRPRAVFLEKAQAMPKQGVSSMFTYGEHFGILQGILIALTVRHELVPPRTWCKVMHAGTTAGTAKERSLEAARRWFPAVNLLATEKSKKPHEGLIDSLLIAEYGRRKLYTREPKTG